MGIYPWQQFSWQRVLRQYNQNRLPHAILCKGPSGIGKLEFANALAQRVLCGSPQQACGHCRDCQLFQAGNHPDFFVVTLVENAKEIKVDQIRAVCEKVGLTAYNQRYQVVLIYPAESMNRASANALLKTLEEPPGNVIIILIAHQIASIAQTIISRCQCLNFLLPQEREALPWLCKELAIDFSSASVLLHLAEGSPKRAVSLGRNGLLRIRDLVWRGLWQLLQDEKVVSEVATEFLKENTLDVLQLIFSVALDVLRLRSDLGLAALQNQDIGDALTKMCARVNIILLAQYLSQVLQAKHRLQHVAGVNVQLLLEGVLLRWQYLRGDQCG